MNCHIPGLPVYHQLLEFTQTHVQGVGDTIQPSHPLSSPSPPARSPSQHQSLFQWVNSLPKVKRWPKYWSFSFSIIPSKEILGLISFRMCWLDLLAVQGTLKSLLQHHSSKASRWLYTIQLLGRGRLTMLIQLQTAGCIWNCRAIYKVATTATKIRQLPKLK